MATTSLHQLALNSEPPSRRELSIAVLTLYAVLFAVLAGKAVDYLRSIDMETSTPSSYSDSRARHV
jgi:hypothetical protein